MPSYMYILECADGSYYTGSTKDLEKRLWQHQNSEGANFTKKRLPVKLVYAEPFDRVEDAFRREKQVQGWSRQKKKVLIEGNYDKLIELSRNYTEYGRPASASDPASATASTGSASAYMVDGEHLTCPTNEPLPEPAVDEPGRTEVSEPSRTIEGSGKTSGAGGRGKLSECVDSGEFGEGGGYR